MDQEAVFCIYIEEIKFIYYQFSYNIVSSQSNEENQNVIFQFHYKISLNLIILTVLIAIN